jgi:RNA polymerase sigma-70 factor (ECF subfamily)
VTTSPEDDTFEDIIRSHGGRLLATARRILGAEEEAARDAVQDALLSAHRSLERFRADASLSTWLHRIVVNAALMRRRSRQRRRETPIDDLLPTFTDDGRHSRMPPSPERVLEQAQLRGAVRACIDRLPDSYRTIIVLRDLEDLSTEEAASALGISPNAVKVRLHRARQALLTLITDRRVPAAVPVLEQWAGAGLGARVGTPKTRRSPDRSGLRQ